MSEDDTPTHGAEDTHHIIYGLRILPKAEQGIREAATHFANLAGDDIAAQWMQGLASGIRRLSTNPHRHPIIPEQRHFTEEVRQLVYRRTQSGPAYRILFVIKDEDSKDGPLILIFHVRHASAQPITRAQAKNIQKQD